MYGTVTMNKVCQMHKPIRGKIPEMRRKMKEINKKKKKGKKKE